MSVDQNQDKRIKLTDLYAQHESDLAANERTHPRNTPEPYLFPDKTDKHQAIVSEFIDGVMELFNGKVVVGPDQNEDKDLDELLTWDIDGHKEPVIFRPEMKKALLAWRQASIDRAVAKTQLRADIKYLTLKARYLRMFRGGEEDALPTKRYVKSLKKKLAALTTPKERKQS